MEQVRAAFSEDTSLVDRIQAAISRHQDEELAFLFSDIVAYIQRLKSIQPQHEVVVNGNKKRKLDTNGTDDTSRTAVFECKDVSFTIPARKKLKLELSSSTSGVKQIRLIDQKTDTTEHTLSYDDVQHVFCLPIPEKATRQQHFAILPKEEDAEQIVFAVNEAPDKQSTVTTRSGSATDGETLADIMVQELGASGLHVEKPSADVFASSISEPHRKGEKAYHVKAFRGSKEGYLYFLASGILFGFKKPLTFFSFGDVESISYTSVLQRTFNLVITTASGQEIEFSMLDQADFAGIDEYIKAHGLNDASMAAERRAKMYNVNKPKGEAQDAQAEGEQEPGDGQTELQRAEQQLQDEEDELEEDYDPSGGESDGEGEESEEEEEDQPGDNEATAEEYDDDDEEEEESAVHGM